MSKSQFNQMNFSIFVSYFHVKIILIKNVSVFNFKIIQRVYYFFLYFCKIFNLTVIKSNLWVSKLLNHYSINLKKSLYYIFKPNAQKKKIINILRKRNIKNV